MQRAAGRSAGGLLQAVLRLTVRCNIAMNRCRVRWDFQDLPWLTGLLFAILSPCRAGIGALLPDIQSAPAQTAPDPSLRSGAVPLLRPFGA